SSDLYEGCYTICSGRQNSRIHFRLAQPGVRTGTVRPPSPDTSAPGMGTSHALSAISTGASMQTTIASVTRPSAVPPSQTDVPADANGGQWASYNVIRRNGSVVGFEPSKIAIAMTKAFLAVNGGQGAASARVRELVETLASQAVNALVRNRPAGGTFHIEDIQDQVEL